MKDAAANDKCYQQFYEAIGDRVPWTEYAHADRGPWSEYKAVLRELRKVATPERTLLDIGCNDGVFTIPWRQMGGGPALGIDIATGFIERASQAAQQRGVDRLRFVTGDIQDLSLDLGTFDVILMSEVLEHLNHPERAMRNVRNHLVDGGVLLLTTPTPACDIMLPLGLRLRYIRGLLSGRVREEYFMTTEERGYDQEQLRRHGVVDYRFRHDAYWPSTLPRWIEGFGFRRLRFYTMIWLLEWFPVRLWRALRSFPAWNYLEMLARRIPGLNMFGAHNVGVFEAVREPQRRALLEED